MNPELFTLASLFSLLTLALLEVILGIDNVIFVSIIMQRMEEAKRKKARFIWMVVGIITRTIMLAGLGWLLTQKGKILFTLPYIEHGFDLASLVMIAGGLFLLVKTVREIHHKVEGDEEAGTAGAKKLSFRNGIAQIILVDMVFSFDSVITASGVAKHLEIMIAAVVIAMIVMFLFAPKIASFIDRHPTIKMLALSFLVMIGLILIVEGWAGEDAHNLHLKNYVYFAMAFSFLVELLNMRMRKKSLPQMIIDKGAEREPQAAEAVQEQKSAS